MGFFGGVAGQLVAHQLGQVQPLGVHGRAGVQAGQFQQLADDGVEVLGVVQGGEQHLPQVVVGIGVEVGQGLLQPELQPGDRVLEVVGGVGERLPVTLDLPLQDLHGPALMVLGHTEPLVDLLEVLCPGEKLHLDLPHPFRRRAGRGEDLLARPVEEGGDLLDPLDDQPDAAVGVRHRGVHHAPVPLLERAGLPGFLEVVAREGDDVGHTVGQHPLQGGPQLRPAGRRAGQLEQVPPDHLAPAMAGHLLVGPVHGPDHEVGRQHRRGGGLGLEHRGEVQLLHCRTPTRVLDPERSGSPAPEETDAHAASTYHSGG